MKNELWVVIHEYSDQDNEGASVCGVFKSYEKAKEKADVLAINEIGELKSVWGSNDVSFNSNKNGHYITSNNECYHDNFRVERTYLED